jgi:hypothetical protein
MLASSAEHNREKVTQREGKTPYETNKEREREQRNKMKSYNNVVV